MADFDDEEVDDLRAEEKGEESVDEAAEGMDAEEPEEDFKESLGDDDLDEFDADAAVDEEDSDLKVVDEALNHKDQNARTLAIRRAIEEREEARRISEDLDYLDLDIDD